MAEDQKQQTEKDTSRAMVEWRLWTKDIPPNVVNAILLDVRAYALRRISTYVTMVSIAECCAGNDVLPDARLTSSLIAPHMRWPNPNERVAAISQEAERAVFIRECGL